MDHSPHFHHEDDNDPIINDLLPYSNFLIGVLQRLYSISVAPFLSDANQISETDKEILAHFNNLIHKVKLGIDGNIDKQSLSVWIGVYINGFNSVKENYHLSQEQGKVVNDILGICHDIWHELNNDDNNPDDSSRHNIKNHINNTERIRRMIYCNIKSFSIKF